MNRTPSPGVDVTPLVPAGLWTKDGALALARRAACSLGCECASGVCAKGVCAN